jgi:hypothetical protein
MKEALKAYELYVSRGGRERIEWMISKLIVFYCHFHPRHQRLSEINSVAETLDRIYEQYLLNPQEFETWVNSPKE